MPEQLAVGRDRQRMSGAGKKHELPVAVGQQIIEILKVGDGSIPVILTADQQHRRQHLLRMHHRHVGRHVEIGAGGDLVAELHLRIRERLDRRNVAGAGFISGCNRTDHVAIAFAHIVGAVIVELLGAFGQCRRSIPLVGERGQHQTVGALGRHHGIGAGAQRTGGLAEEMVFLAAGFAGDDFHRRLQVLDAARDVGIAGGAPGFAVVLVIHRPDIKPIAGERIHHGIFAMAGHVEIERPRGDRRTMDEEEDRPRRLAGLGRAEPLAKHPQGHIALLGPVFAAPDLAAFCCRACVLGGKRSRDASGNEAQSRALDDGAPPQRLIEFFHDSSPITGS